MLLIPSRIHLSVLLAAALAISGCARKAQETLDEAALQAISEQAAAELNEPGAAMIALVKALDRPSPIAPEALVITLDQKATQVDWWLSRHGMIHPISPIQDASRPIYLTSPDAVRALASASTDWFEAGAGPPDEVDCQTPAALEAQGCEADLTLTLALTPAGVAMLGEGLPLQPLKLHVLVARAGEGWEVKTMRGEGGLSVHDIALNILLGNEQARAAARQATLDTFAARSTVELNIPTPEAFAIGDTPPPLDIAPVPPEAGDNPLAPPPRRSPAPRSVP